MKLFQKMLTKVVSLAVDGAALKAARLLVEMHMPNAIVIFRDASHAIPMHHVVLRYILARYIQL